MALYTAAQLKEISDNSTIKADAILSETMEQMHVAAEGGETQISFPSTPSTIIGNLLKSKLEDQGYTVDTAGDPPVPTLIKWDSPT